MADRFITEDADERRMFNDMVTTMGSPLRVISVSLEIWSKTYPAGGSMSRQCAIMSNEARKAAEAAGEKWE